MTEGAASHMKKPGRKAKTGNPAAARRGEGAPDKRSGGWIWREVNAFFGLPEWLAFVVFALLIGVPVALWRWLAG